MTSPTADADRDETLHRRRVNQRLFLDALSLPRAVNPEFAEGLESTLELLRDQNEARARIIRRLRAELTRERAKQRHRPLTDETCGVIPTKAGLDYLALRRQQHSKAAEQ